MECPECKKDFDEGVKSAYKLGLLDGEERLKETINKVLKNNTKLLVINQELARELLRLDQLLPLKDKPSIIIPLKKAEQILKELKHGPSKAYLSSLMHEQFSSSTDLADK
jgi:hypothetical protein